MVKSKNITTNLCRRNCKRERNIVGNLACSRACTVTPCMQVGDRACVGVTTVETPNALAVHVIPFAGCSLPLSLSFSHSLAHFLSSKFSTFGGKTAPLFSPPGLPLLARLIRVLPYLGDSYLEIWCQSEIHRTN